MALSVNTASGDMNERRSLSDHTSPGTYGTLPPNGSAYHYSSPRPSGESQLLYDQRACCGKMSPVRRTFCLITAFDLVLTFIMWVIYTQSLSMGFRDSFTEEVANYTFEESLFDTVLCSAWRCVPLLLAYALFRCRNPYIVAITTTGTCIFLIVKVFLFNFSGKQNHNNIICYLLLVVSFIIAWIETIILDFKVLPAEERARTRELSESNVRAPLLHPESIAPYAASEFHTPQGSDDEEEDESRRFQSPSHSRHPSQGSMALSLGAEEREYAEKGRESWEEAWSILMTKDGWKLEAGSSLESGIVYAKTFPKFGKLFKLEGYINAPPSLVFRETVIKVNDAPKWNPTILHCKTLQTVDDNTDISYNVAAEGAGGFVSSRDFVTLRHWDNRDGIYLSAGTAVHHPDAPTNKTYVRGENKTGGWACIPVTGDPNRCKFCWILGTDLKGWIPQYAVDTALSGTLLEFFKHLQDKMTSVMETENS